MRRSRHGADSFAYQTHVLDGQNRTRKLERVRFCRADRSMRERPLPQLVSRTRLSNDT